MRSVNNWLAFSLSPHLTIDNSSVPADHAAAAQGNGPHKMTQQHSSAPSENGLSFNGGGGGAPSGGAGECYSLGQSDGGDTLSMRPDGSLCIMEALSRSQSGDWAQLKTGHVQQRPSQHLLNAELSRLAGSRAPSEHHHHHQYDSLGVTTTHSNKSDRDSGPKLEDFLGGASSLGGQYNNNNNNTSSSSRTSDNNNFENFYLRDINVNLSPYSSGGAANAIGGGNHQQQQQTNHVPPSFHAYGLQQRTDNNNNSHNNNNSSSSRQPYDSHSRHSHSTAGGGSASAADANAALCHSNVHAQNLLQVAFVDHHQQQHHHHHLFGGGGGGSGGGVGGSSSSTTPPTGNTVSGGGSGGDNNMLQDCTLQLPSHQGPNLAALKTWLRHSQVAAAAAAATGVVSVGNGGASLGGGNVNASGTGGGAVGEKAGINGKHNGSSSMSSIAGFNHQTLSLSMSPGSQSSNSLAAAAAAAVQQQQQQPGGGTTSITSDSSPETRKRGAGSRTGGSKEASPRKSIDTFGQRTSVFRGVTRHRWTGRYEAHLWDNSCRKEGQTRKGRQVYLGGYDKEEKAARAYDLAALKYWGPNTTINFPLQQYEKELEEMKNMTRQEYVASLRRKSSGFSRGASVYRGVTRHHQHGRWQARIGRVAGNKDLYLGTYSTQEEAAEAYDIAAIKFRGINAVTNFDISRYDTKRICGTAHNAVDEESTPKKVDSSSFKELAVMRILDQPSDPSVDGHQTDDDTQSLQTGNTNSTSHLTSDLSKSQLQDWQQMLYHPPQQQQHRTWDEPNHHHHQHHQHHHQQQQDMRTQTLISDSLGYKFLQQSPVGGTMHHHSAVLRNLMGLSDSGAAAASGSESNSGGMLAGLTNGSSSSPLMGGGGGASSGFPGGGGAPSPRDQQHSDDVDSSKSAGAHSYGNVLPGDLSRHILFMPHGQSSPPHHPSGGTKSSSSYDNNSNSSLGNQSWMSTTPSQGSLNQRVSAAAAAAAAGHLGVGHIPIFAVWND